MTEKKQHVVYPHKGGTRRVPMANPDQWHVFDEFWHDDRYVKTTLRASYPGTDEGRGWAYEESDRINKDKDFEE